MKYHEGISYYEEKKFPGFSVIYLHNSDECFNCQLSLRSVFDVEKTPQKAVRKKKNSSGSTPDSLSGLLLGAELVLKKSEIKFPLPLKCDTEKLSKKKAKASKKTGLNPRNSIAGKASPSDNKKKNLKPVKSSPKTAKKKPSVEGNAEVVSSLKKKACDSDKKVNETKVPGKGTLKRKRWFLDKLNNSSENYEDDFFEDKKFGHFQSLLEDDSDGSEKYEGLKTPVLPFSISPRPATPSPTYKDCYSPTLLSIYRKGAEEYQYRRKKRKKLPSSEKMEDTITNPQSREEDVKKRLEEVARILFAERKRNERTSDSDEDMYFSDVLSVSSKTNP